MINEKFTRHWSAADKQALSKPKTLEARNRFLAAHGEFLGLSSKPESVEVRVDNSARRFEQVKDDEES